ncbi:uncharacterized protein METZ01_LOCUS307898, partial [marine metagenome]
VNFKKEVVESFDIDSETAKDSFS